MAEQSQRRDLSFSREDFFSGGPALVDNQVELRVENGLVSRDVPEVFRLIYRFTNMLVQSVSQVDAERTQYLLSSNDTVKLYTFDRAITVIALQAVLIDGKIPDKELPKNAPPQYRQDGYEQFMWLYEHELRMNASVRKNRRIVLRTKNFDHEILVTNYHDGFASEGEWMVMASLEFIVLSSQLLGMGPSSIIGKGTGGKDILSTASRELLYRLTIEGEPTSASVSRSGGGGGVAEASRQAKKSRDKTVIVGPNGI
jgi:hypothetical protein